MSLTLGEKLRQAREERGFTLSEVAEQTRISSLYLESIENDDYRTLPGGIFNKGFVKSFAKFVGVNEQEALLDYSQILADAEINEDPTLKLYKPEVLTDDRSGASMIPTVIVAVVILALMTGGILFLVNYLRRPATPTVAGNSPKTNANTGGDPANANTETAPSNAPDMATLKVEFKALSQPVSLAALVDGTKADKSVSSGVTAIFEPKESLSVNYNKWNADKIQMTINGKAITLPGTPLNPKDKRIEFTINKDNIGQIWTSGAISTDVAGANPDANANVTTAPVQTRSTPAPKATPTANTAAKPTPEAKPTGTPAKPNTTKPPTMTGKPTPKPH